MNEDIEKQINEVNKNVEDVLKQIDVLASAVTESSDSKVVEFELKLQMFKYRSAYSKAMAKFQQQVPAPKKNGHVDYSGKGGRTKYDYVTLDDLIASITTGIKDTGLSWQQETLSANGVVRVRTLIMHENGYQYTSPWIEFKVAAKPQDVGSAMTYAKRYSLGSAFGISSEPDDDGQGAQESQSGQNGNSKGQAKRPNGYSNNNPQNGQNASNGQTEASRMDTKQVGLANDLVKSIAETTHKPVSEIRSRFLEMFGVKMYSDPDQHKGDQLIEQLTRQLEKINSKVGGSSDK